METSKKKEKEIKVFEGTVTRTFGIGKKQYAPNQKFKTKDKRTFDYLLTTKRIVK